jgi:DNA-directed RNA polymerase subunit beta
LTSSACLRKSKRIRNTLKKTIDRKLAARVLKTWTEDFVDEDTGEVVSIDRNEVLLERDHVITAEDVDVIVESGVKSIILHSEDVNAADYHIIFNTLAKDNSNSEKEAVEQIYRQLRNTEAPDEQTARDIIQSLFFSEKRYDLGEVGRYRINKKLGLDLSFRSACINNRGYYPYCKIPDRSDQLKSSCR